MKIKLAGAPFRSWVTNEAAANRHSTNSPNLVVFAAPIGSIQSNNPADDS